MPGLSGFHATRELSHMMAVAVVACLAVSAQQVAMLQGLVIDENQHPVGRAAVKIIDRNTAKQIVTTTNDKGEFQVDSVPSGSFDLSVTASGFFENRITNVQFPTDGKRLTVTLRFLDALMDGPSHHAKKPVAGEVSVATTMSGGVSMDAIDAGENTPPPPLKHVVSITHPNALLINRLGSKPADAIWNIWTEEPTDANLLRFQPAELHPGKNYLLAVDMAAIPYNAGSSIALSQAISDHLGTILRNQPGQTANIQVLIVPDERSFESQADNQRLKSFVVDLAKLKGAAPAALPAGTSAFDFLRAHDGDAPFSFATKRAVFHLRTKDVADGPAAIALSFWVDGKPVDELSYSVCIIGPSRKPCPQAAPYRGMKGVDLMTHNSLPDAALHFIELDSTTLIGVFRCNTCGWAPDDFKTWSLGRGTEWFRDQVQRTVLPNVKLASVGSDPLHEKHYNPKTLENAGDALYSILFHSEGSGPVEAETAFRAFVADRVAKQHDAKHPVSLFVRLLPHNIDEGFIVPVGLARVPISAGAKDFLGFHFTIEMPLELQDYTAESGCVSNWVLLVPPKGFNANALKEARSKFADWITTFESASSAAKVFSDLNAFHEWLSPADPPKMAAGEGVIILSHHENNTLFFDQDDGVIFPDVKRPFAAPSVAILGACATASPGAFEFVREFNQHGVSSIIASSVDVDARMGGAFLTLIANTVRDHAGETDFRLGQAFFQAIQDLSKQSDEDSDSPQPYGPRSLIFGLIGNGNVRLCFPKPAAIAAGAHAGGQ